MSTIELTDAPQRAFLFGTDRAENRLWGQQPLEELGRLAETAGAQVAGRAVQHIRVIDPHTYIGRGKAGEIGSQIQELGAQLAVFDDELSPGQAGHLEEVFGVQVLDRSELILDIFARHARTSQARLQVELAQLEYLLPRLKRMWVHLSRIRGGIGLRGPGEKQIETDRRIIQRRISLLHKKLEKISRQHSVRLKSRRGLMVFSLVGYTNAGKSSLLNGLTGSRVPVRDQLFSTLDTTTRKLELPGGREVLATDTVGFISRLPHHLVASFKATLEEVREADHLLVVADVSNPHFQERLQVVDRVLAEIGAEDLERTYVFNKVDRVEDRQSLSEVAEQYPDHVFTSAVGKGPALRHLVERMTRVVEQCETEFSVDLGPGEGRLAAAFHRLGCVVERRSSDKLLSLRVRMRKSQLDRLLSDIPYNGQITFHGGNLD
ncbi:MAG: GTPase HflX [Candidatus Glassbacteria bacterium]|nr:GTPase HflX [Candidatus Glassbacteria bacterium]